MSDPDARSSQHGDENILHVEVSALDGGTPVTRGPRRRWVRVAQASSALVVVLALLAVVVVPRLGLGSRVALTHTGTSALPTAITYNGQPLTCPAGATWSPGSDAVAILDYVACHGVGASNVPAGGALAIYPSGIPASLPPQVVYSLDPLVIQQGLPASTTRNAQIMANLAISYMSVAWSPDGQTIAVTYFARSAVASLGENSSAQQDEPLATGVLLLPAHDPTGQVRVFDEPVSAVAAVTAPTIVAGTTSPPAPSPTTVPVPRYGAWNLTTGKIEGVGVPIGLGYTWGPGNTLTTTDPLTAEQTFAGAASHAAPGNAVGGASFTLWQSGDASIVNIPCPTSTATPDPYAPPAPVSGPPYVSLRLRTAGAVWSPDGALLLVTGINVHGWVDVPVTPSELDPENGCGYGDPANAQMRLPVRDAALRAVLTNMPPGSVQLAWRPDGQRLAVETSGSGDSLSIYDCATGTRLASESLADVIPAGGSTLMYWSPDGLQLLVLGVGGQLFTVLDAAQLGG